MKKKLLFLTIGILLLSLLIVPFFIAKTDPNSIYLERDITGPVFYAVMLALAVHLLISYIVFSERKYIWVLLSFVSICIANCGYLSLSLANNVSEALLANRISYFGNVYMLLFLAVTLANACGIRFSRPVISLLFSISSIMFLFAASQGYLDLFYRNVSFEIVDGYARILKDYGPMHTVYIIYILAYFMLIVGTVIYATVKKKTYSKPYVALIFGIGLVNVSVWFIERLIPHQIEFLSLSYVLNGALLFYIYRMYQKLAKDGIFDSYLITVKIRTEDSPEKVLDFVMQDRNTDEVFSQGQPMEFEKLSEEELRDLIARIPAEHGLTDRETDVAVLLLRNLKRKDMASALYVSEDTIKTHTAHIYGKLNVTSRRALQEMAEKVAEKGEQP